MASEVDAAGAASESDKLAVIRMSASGTVAARPFWRARATVAAAIVAVAGGLLLANASTLWQSFLHLRIRGEALAQKRKALDEKRREIDRRFQQGVAMLHIGEFDHAITALHRVLVLAPEMPEAHVNMGFALLGQERHKAATDFFRSAIGLRADQRNAYYGLALALEASGDRAGALGAMRTYVHLAPEADRHRARALEYLAKWEGNPVAAPAAAKSPERSNAAR